MTADEIKMLILEIIQEIVPDENLNDLDSEAPLREQIDMDSMDFLDIIMALRKRFRINVPEADYGKFATLHSSTAYLEPLMKDL